MRFYLPLQSIMLVLLSAGLAGCSGDEEDQRRSELERELKQWQKIETERRQVYEQAIADNPAPVTTEKRDRLATAYFTWQEAEGKVTGIREQLMDLSLHRN